VDEEFVPAGLFKASSLNRFALQNHAEKTQPQVLYVAQKTREQLFCRLRHQPERVT